MYKFLFIHRTFYTNEDYNNEAQEIHTHDVALCPEKNFIIELHTAYPYTQHSYARYIQLYIQYIHVSSYLLLGEYPIIHTIYDTHGDFCHQEKR